MEDRLEFGVEGTVPQGSASSGDEVDPLLVRAIGFQMVCNGGNAFRWTPMTLATRCRMSESTLLSQIASQVPRMALERAVTVVTGFPVKISVEGIARQWIVVQSDRSVLDEW